MRVLLVDDHPIFREGMAVVLAGLADVELVGEAEDGEAAVRLSGELEPDVVIMDLHLPGINGIEATRQILAARPEVAVLALTMLEGEASVAAAVRAGARGYLLKGAGRDRIAAALDAVAAGAAYFGPGVGLEGLTRPVNGGPGGHPGFPHLTERELDILTLMAQGLANPAIAARLHLSDKTVRNYVSGVITKIGAADRSQAIVMARDQGLR
jgi:DNA-binding NarL/FixJ family response regulator